MTTDCSLNYKFNTWKFQAQTFGEHVVYTNCFRHSEQFLYTTCPAKRSFDKDVKFTYLDWQYIGQMIGGDFAKFCGLLRIYELYLYISHDFDSACLFVSKETNYQMFHW